MNLSTDKILDAAARLVDARLEKSANAWVLDIGSGTGALLTKLRTSHPSLVTFACDYTDELMQLPGQKVDVADLSKESLPYADASFDVVTCTEVIEHLENYRGLLREVNRVLKPGGLAVFTTPNILNIQSRLRFLWFGFWTLFGPLPIGRNENFSTTGHITPINYFYLAHGLEEAGLRVDRLTIDKIQRKGVIKLLPLWPFVMLFGNLALRREVHKYKTITPENARFVREMNSTRALLGRTLIVAARKEPVNRPEFPVGRFV